MRVADAGIALIRGDHQIRLPIGGEIGELVVERRAGARGAAANWTEQKNARRCALIELEVDGMLSEEEAIELESLQGEMLRERQKLAPVPLADLRRLHQDLMTKAQEQANSRRS